MDLQYVIVPRRHLYWIEATGLGGKRHAVACFQDERQALRCLRELQDREQEGEQRRFAIANSRYSQ
jgi:hypothetical protein